MTGSGHNENICPAQNALTNTEYALDNKGMTTTVRNEHAYLLL